MPLRVFFVWAILFATISSARPARAQVDEDQVRIEIYVKEQVKPGAIPLTLDRWLPVLREAAHRDWSGNIEYGRNLAWVLVRHEWANYQRLTLSAALDENQGASLERQAAAWWLQVAVKRLDSLAAQREDGATAPGAGNVILPPPEMQPILLLAHRYLGEIQSEDVPLDPSDAGRLRGLILDKLNELFRPSNYDEPNRHIAGTIRPAFELSGEALARAALAREQAIQTIEKVYGMSASAYINKDRDPSPPQQVPTPQQVFDLLSVDEERAFFESESFREASKLLELNHRSSILQQSLVQHIGRLRHRLELTRNENIRSLSLNLDAQGSPVGMAPEWIDRNLRGNDRDAELRIEIAHLKTVGSHGKPHLPKTNETSTHVLNALAADARSYAASSQGPMVPFALMTRIAELAALNMDGYLPGTDGGIVLHEILKSTFQTYRRRLGAEIPELWRARFNELESKLKATEPVPTGELTGRHQKLFQALIQVFKEVPDTYTTNFIPSPNLDVRELGERLANIRGRNPRSSDPPPGVNEPKIVTNTPAEPFLLGAAAKQPTEISKNDKTGGEANNGDQKPRDGDASPINKPDPNFNLNTPDTVATLSPEDFWMELEDRLKAGLTQTTDDFLDRYAKYFDSNINLSARRHLQLGLVAYLAHRDEAIAALESGDRAVGTHIIQRLDFAKAHLGKAREIKPAPLNEDGIKAVYEFVSALSRECKLLKPALTTVELESTVRDVALTSVKSGAIANQILKAVSAQTSEVLREERAVKTLASRIAESYIRAITLLDNVPTAVDAFEKAKISMPQRNAAFSALREGMTNLWFAAGFNLSLAHEPPIQRDPAKQTSWDRYKLALEHAGMVETARTNAEQVIRRLLDSPSPDVSDALLSWLYEHMTDVAVKIEPAIQQYRDGVRD